MSLISLVVLLLWFCFWLNLSVPLIPSFLRFAFLLPPSVNSCPETHNPRCSVFANHHLSIRKEHHQAHISINMQKITYVSTNTKEAVPDVQASHTNGQFVCTPPPPPHHSPSPPSGHIKLGTEMCKFSKRLEKSSK